LQQIKKIIYLCPDHELWAIKKQNKMGYSTLFIQETENIRALNIFMSFSLLAVNILLLSHFFNRKNHTAFLNFQTDVPGSDASYHITFKTVLPMGKEQ
jgi:hypothetical protein